MNISRQAMAVGSGRFIYNANSARIVFGAGSISKVGDEVRAADRRRALVLSTPSRKRAADLAVESPYWDPRPVERGAVLALLQRAWEGARTA